VNRAAAVALGAAAGYGAERAVMRLERGRPDVAAAHDFSPLPDTLHHTVHTDDGGHIHVVERGEGRPVLLLHGVTLSAVTWHYQLLDLAGELRVLAMDHRGHGRSIAGEGGYPLERLGQDVRAVLEELDLRDAVLAGHSMGGMVLQRFLVDHPEVVAERVRAVALIGTLAHAGLPLPGWELLAAVATPAAARGLRLAGRLPGGYVPSTDLSYLITRLGLGRSPSPTHVELTRAMVAATPADVLADLWTGIMGWDVREELHSVVVERAIVAVGTKDRICPPRDAKEIAAHLRGAELRSFPGAGHQLMLERRDEVDGILRELAC
jgi:pimeloyl-ACP methyl ester carboxylesterase